MTRNTEVSEEPPPQLEASLKTRAFTWCRRVLFLLALTTLVGSLIVRFWPIERDILVPFYDLNERCGLVNLDGRIAVEAEWDWLEGVDEGTGVSRVMQDNRFGLLNSMGEIIHEPRWPAMTPFGPEGLARVTASKVEQVDNPWAPGKNASVRGKEVFGYCGWINRKGEIVIPAIWDVTPRVPREWNFNQFGLVRVEKNEKVGWVNCSGDVVVEPVWDKCHEFDSQGMAAVLREERFGSEFDQWGWIDTQGRMVIKPWWTRFRTVEVLYYPSRIGKGIEYFDEYGLAIVSVGNPRNDRWGAIDRTGKVVISTKSDVPFKFDANGMAVVKREGQLRWIDRQGDVLLGPIAVDEWDDGSKKYYWNEKPERGFSSQGLAPVYIDNLVEMMRLAAESDAAAGQAYNAMDDDRVTWKEYAPC